MSSPSPSASPRPLFAFWPHTTDPNVASTRIRVLQVVEGLRAQGHAAALFDPAAAGPPPAVIVLGKRYDTASIDEAQRWRAAHGSRLVLDLCDNHFHFNEPLPQWVRRAAILRHAVRQVDHVVTASAALADVVRSEIGAATPVSVIGDSLDMALEGERVTLQHRWHSLRLRAFLALHPVDDGRRLLWFGNHGSSYADGGLQDLASIAQALHAHHLQRPLTLTVVSNSAQAYATCIAGWTLPSTYVPWSGPLFRQALASHSIAVIPACLNPFTSCKTNNRLATAFCNGLAVAADRIPSYEEFADLAVIGDWSEGLAALMADSTLRRQRIADARQRLSERYGTASICSQWAALCSRLSESAPAESTLAPALA